MGKPKSALGRTKLMTELAKAFKIRNGAHWKKALRVQSSSSPINNLILHK